MWTISKALLASLIFAGLASAQIIPGGGSSSGGGSGPAIVTNGLIGHFQILPSESPASLVDYSGNGNGAIGTVGTSPTIIAGTGGLQCVGASGAVILNGNLNSALTIQIEATAPYSAVTTAPIMGNGNGAASGGTGILVSPIGVPATPGAYTLVDAQRISSTNGGTVIGNFAQPRSAIIGLTNIALLMDTLDRIFVNGTEEAGTYFSQARSSAGRQTTGQYQLCGSATGTNASTYAIGRVYYALFYNRVLTNAEVMQNALAMQQALAQRGVPIALSTSQVTMNFDTTSSQAPDNMWVADGDSISQFGTVPNQYVQNVVLNNGFIRNGQGLTGITLATMVATADQVIDPFYHPVAPRNLVTVWGGTNDGCNPSTNAVLGSLQKYVADRHRIGWKVIPITMMSRNTLDACKNTFDTAIRLTWKTFADGLIDVASDPNMGADGANASATYFQAGGIHPTQFAVYNDITPMIQRGINRAYGNLDFSSANVYTTPAAAATATTAGSEATNTVTITFGATPANCLAGSTMTLAGITPAGYNGNYWIITRSATQVTLFNSTTGLGAISVQGTGVCPQQVDADVYTILNFGAGNFTMESCQGYTGQNLYFQNINGVASTLVPFGSETITGTAAPTTVAANTTAILQAQLVSSTAAGCNWVRLQ